jgi:hypothetical protein
MNETHIEVKFFCANGSEALYFISIMPTTWTMADDEEALEHAAA